MPLTITSSAFSANGEMPLRYTGEGEDVSPPLTFAGVPQNAQSLALIVTDPDAPDPAAPQRVVTHWVVYNIPPDTRQLTEGIKQLPKGTQEGLNEHQHTGYMGPMPPIGSHRYYFKLYALDTRLDFSATPTRATLETAIKGHVLADAQLIGTYQAKKK